MKRAKEVFTSWRFWCLVFIAVVEALQVEGVLDDGVIGSILDGLELVAGGATGVRTIDRFSEKLGANKA